MLQEWARGGERHKLVSENLPLPPLRAETVEHFAVCFQTLHACMLQLTRGSSFPPLTVREYLRYADQKDRLSAFKELVQCRCIDSAPLAGEAAALVQSLAFSIPPVAVLHRKRESGPGALVLDSDGVVVDTCSLHLRAWQRAISELMDGIPHAPGLNRGPLTEDEHSKHISGLSRLDGLRSFLEARELRLDETVLRAWAERKNAYFQELLGLGDIPVFESTIEVMRRCRQEGMAVAIASSSRNTVGILLKAGVMEHVDLVIDGVAVEALGLRPKPAADIFLAACRRLGVDPHNGVGIEDAPNGVAALVEGGFGVVVAVARAKDADQLTLEHPDVVLPDMAALPHELKTFFSALPQLRHAPPRRLRGAFDIRYYPLGA